MSRRSSRAGKPVESRRSARALLRHAIGPGLIAALVLSVFIWRRALLSSPGGPPRIERSRIEAPQTVPTSAPDPAWLLQQGQALQLTPAQSTRLLRLKARWDRQTAGLRQNLARAEATFRREIAPQDGRNPDLDRIRQQAEPVSDLSRQLTSAREAWWGEAQRVLTAAQRRRAEEAWAAHFHRPVGHFGISTGSPMPAEGSAARAAASPVTYRHLSIG